MRTVGKRTPPKGKWQITFKEFLTYVIQDQKNMMGDRHWSRIHRVCSICTFDYDFVMKLETFTEDLSFLAHKLNMTELDVNIQRNANRWTGKGSGPSTEERASKIQPSTLHYYLDIPADLLCKIIRNYWIDFQLFDYEIPEEIIQIISKYNPDCGKL
ncbi:hypothetical protein SK128_006740 [Halocaridina rubra]|uniref:Carbohydrate sulfotransferase n=1 Tax=Halocaridina rubra TaxID=373956 RepID=A0AAN8WXW0_HALRR